MKWLALVPLLAGCDFLWRLKHLDPATVDAHVQPPLVDSDYKAFDAGPCAGTLVGYAGRNGSVPDGLIQICIPAPPPKGDYVLLSNVDTGGTACDQVVVQADMTQLCVITASTITIPHDLVVTGARPLVLAAIDGVFVHGNLSVASHMTGDPGPGASYRGCAGGTGGPAAANGGGGGAGGSFATYGGSGGDSPNGGGAGGMPNVPAMTIDRVRGGCGGGNGGDGAMHTTGAGVAGASGGAVYIVAGARIDVAATIDASGAGGAGGDRALSEFFGGGGGGGGSGGMIALDAPMITISAASVLIANGGSGGSGGGTDGTTNPGSDPDPASYSTCAHGGATVLGGGAGGDGACITTDAQPGVGSTMTGGGSGGGGGSAGYIVLYTPVPMPNAMASPAPYLNP